jgi:hypothetical protein
MKLKQEPPDGLPARAGSPPVTQSRRDDPSAQRATNEDAPAWDWPTLGVLELRYIHRVMAYADNNKTRAAALLGITRKTVSRILARERQNAQLRKTERQNDPRPKASGSGYGSSR